MVNSVPTAKTYPTRFNQREAKVIDTCLSGTGTLTAKTITSSTIGVTNTVSLYDSLFQLGDNSTPTKLLKFQLSGQNAGSTTINTAGTDVTLTLPAATGTLASLAGTEVLENKVLEATCAMVDTTDKIGRAHV